MNFKRWFGLGMSMASLLIMVPAAAQDDGLAHQWASSASATSEYSSTDYNAMQATGAPNTAQCADAGTAWASSAAQSPKEALTLYFDNAVWATQINIYETFTPGSITGIALIPATGADPIPVANSAGTNNDCPGIFSIDITGDVPSTVNGVIIYLDQRKGGNWDEIDAVELVGSWPSGEDATGPSTDTQQTTENTGPSGMSVTCDNGAVFDNGIEFRVVNMRAGYTYTATAIGINGFDPVLAVLNTAGRGLCSDDDQYAAQYSASLPDAEAPANGSSAQVFFSNNSSNAFQTLSLVVGGLNNAKGEFVLILEGMALTTADGEGDPFSVAITPGMIASGVSPSVYMFTLNTGLDPFIAMIDGDYNFLKESGSKGNYYACDNAGYSCWGESTDLSNYYISRTGGRGILGTGYDAMLKLPVQAGQEGSFYNFLMRSAGMKSFGDYSVAFHAGIG